ncbi:MAG: stage II sporulation protein M [Bacteroidetes bacterium]|nr:MAG: stage II sporulation protein M [Bacteroidota bacterium]
MREPAFLRQNKDKWLEYERMLFEGKRSDMDPDRLAELYVQLTDDLAYARTFYPRSQVVRYLNGLAARTHLAIYRNKKDPRSRFLTFWTRELPLIYRRNHRYMLYAFLIFSFSFVLGLLGALHEEDFVRVVLGDAYVNMTLENIENGDPMGVYKRSSSFVMFVEIAFNNIRVAFNAFAMGVLLSVGTIYLLFYNGVMVGAFLTFFHTQNQLWEALPVVYIHGTLELSAIVIAGGAGFMLGNSILFPGTYTRLASVQRAAREGVKILVGLVPVFLIAAFLESYITRLTEMWLGFKLVIILVSLGFVLWYYLFYPILYARAIGTEPSAP